MYISFNNLPAYNYNNFPNTLKNRTKYFSTYENTVSFKQKNIPPEALKYLEERTEKLKQVWRDMPKYATNIDNYDARKLEGIQKGIKIFDGLSFSQIKYFVSKLREIILQRGCNNKCIHCYAEAETPYFMKKNNLTQTISFEDYENLINGLRELNKRLGFNAFPYKCSDYSMTLFHDSDCSAINLQDKNGKMYDYADLSKMLHDVTRRVILFDTSGWNVNDKKTQKRMEDLVQKIANSNEYNFMQFYISINPFHSIYSKAIELEKMGKFDASNKLKKIYTDRVANALFTFSPLIGKRNSMSKKPMIGFIIRALEDGNDPNLYEYTQDNMTQICDKILEKLEKLYTKDLESSSPKVVKNTNLKNKYLNYMNTKIGNSLLAMEFQPITISDRLTDNITKDTLREHNSIIAERFYNPAKKLKRACYGILDINGKFYVSDDIKTYPTNISLNYTHKGKTAPMQPNLQDEKISV